MSGLANSATPLEKYFDEVDETSVVSDAEEYVVLSSTALETRRDASTHATLAELLSEEGTSDGE
jgi:hypothetical protein